MPADKNIQIFGVTGYGADAGGVREIELSAEGKATAGQGEAGAGQGEDGWLDDDCEHGIQQTG